MIIARGTEVFICHSASCIHVFEPEIKHAYQKIIIKIPWYIIIAI